MQQNLPEVFTKEQLCEFDICWNELKKQHPNNIIKCKKLFARDATLKIKCLLSSQEFDKYISYNVTTAEILNFVFKAHLHYTENLTDSERAEKQKDIKHLEKIVNLYINALLWKSNRKKLTPHIPYCLHYETIISMCNFCLENIFADLHYELDDISKERYIYMGKLYKSAFKKLKVIYDLYAKEFIEEAATLFRSLHELECTIIVLNQCKKRIVYMTYQGLSECYNYVLYTRDKNIDVSQDELNKEKELFNNYKEKLKCNEKIDPMDFISYGWLRTIEGCENVRINGTTLRKIAKQDKRRGAYTLSSQFSHHNAVVYEFDENRVARFLLEEIDTTFENIWNEWLEFNNFYHFLNDSNMETLYSLVDMYNITNSKR